MEAKQRQKPKGVRGSARGKKVAPGKTPARRKKAKKKRSR